MNKRTPPTQASSTRRTEKWFRIGLWALAVVFACFLIGLGSKIAHDLPKVENSREWYDYADQSVYRPLVDKKGLLEEKIAQKDNELSQATLALEQQQNQTATAKHRFEASLGTRTASEQNSQNARVFERTQEYDQLMVKEQAFDQKVQALRQEKLALEQDLADTEQGLLILEQDILPIKEADDRRIEFWVFLYRLALTLPLLVVAFYLFRYHRRSRYFPFVWGFIGFALFAFFVELVPYLPSYGGYVRYSVGILMTVVVGKYAIHAMYRYLEQKKAEEASPNKERASLDYELAHTRLAKGICPACERPLDFNNPVLDFCPHCAVQLFTHCTQCNTRSSAFNRYCYQCGTAHHNHSNHKES